MKLLIISNSQICLIEKFLKKLKIFLKTIESKFLAHNYISTKHFVKHKIFLSAED